MTDDELETRLGDALAPPRQEPSAERVAALRARAEQARAEQARTEQAPVPTGRPRGRSLLALAAVTALLVAAGALGARLASGPAGSEQDLLARGEPEFRASLAREEVQVTLDGSRAPEGRIVVLESDTLPVLPLGEYYELWFVGPEDSPASPDRVSAGTFHPDYDDGRTLVVLHAAVDPDLFGEVEITAEVADGDPAPSEQVVLRGPLERLDGGPA